MMCLLSTNLSEWLKMLYLELSITKIRRNPHPTGATGRKALVYINNKIRMSVCLFVCLTYYSS